MIDSTDPESSTTSNTIYFADRPYEGKQFAAECFAFAESYIEWVTDTGLERRWIQNGCLYDGVDPNATTDGTWNQDSFRVTGDNGELLSSTYNDYRNLLQHILNMTVSQPPAMLAKAINDEEASLVASQTFDGVFNYYLHTHKSGRLLKESRSAVERCLYQDSGFMLCEWDRYEGEPIGEKMELAPDPMTGQPVPQPVLDERGQPQLEYEGDLTFAHKSVWDVFWDPGCESEQVSDWMLVRDQVNKYEYAKRYPTHSKRILGTTQTNGGDKMRNWRRGFARPSKTNMIDVWKFYHRLTCNMPKGRHAILLDAATVLEDGPNPYKIIPVFHVKAMDGQGSIVGYAPGNVLAPVQQAQDVLSSSMMTNFAMFGVQNIAVKDSDQFDVTELAGSLNVLRYADQPPIPVQLGQQMNGIDEHYDRLGRKGETLSGVNSVIRGDPESSLKSGKALGIVQAAAVQFQSALAASYAQFLKDIGNFMLYCFRTFLKNERITQIVGENDRLQSATWDRDTFGPIDRVEAELVDPAMRTLGYKTDLAMFLVQNNMVRTPQEFLTVLTTGQLKPLIRAELTEINLVHQENKDMLEAAKTMGPQLQQMQQQAQQTMQLAQSDPNNQIAAQIAQQVDGQMKAAIAQIMPPVILEDDDDLHIAEHKGVLASPATRRNAAVTMIALAHIQEHHANKVRKAIREVNLQLDVQAATIQAQAAHGIMPAPPEEDGKNPNKAPEKEKQAA